MQESIAKLIYRYKDCQGECKIKQVKPVSFNKPLYYTFVFFSAFFLFIPLLVIKILPHLKRIFYNDSTLQEVTHFHIINHDQQQSFNKKQFIYSWKKESAGQVFFQNRGLVYSVKNHEVSAETFDYEKRLDQILECRAISEIIYNQQTVRDLHKSFKDRQLYTAKPFLLKIILKQLIKPIYFLVYYSCSLWIYEKYYYYAGVILITFCLGVVLNVYVKNKQNEKIFAMAKNENQVLVLREGGVLSLRSEDIVPGDIIFLKQNIKIPFDGIILQGEILISEKQIMGEVTPVIKRFNPNNGLKSAYIEQGSKIIQVYRNRLTNKFKSMSPYGVPLMVCQTNFLTKLGQALRFIKFSRFEKAYFHSQNSKFLFIQFGLGIALYIAIIVRFREFFGQNIVEKLLDITAIAVPPGISISIIIGIFFALIKMNNKGIGCNNPYLIMKGGFVNLALFDKTGTLTQSQISLSYLVLAKNKQFLSPFKIKSKMNEQIFKSDSDLMSLVLNNIGANHTLVSIRNQIQGNPLEKVLFQFADFTLQQRDPSDHEHIIYKFNGKRNEKGVVYKVFEFDYILARTSAIAKSNLNEQILIYTKGSPEILANIFLKESLPHNYFSEIKKYTSKGYRVLAFGSRKIHPSQMESQRINLQKNLEFNGFYIFENELKAKSRQTIEQLKEANIKCIQVTGDDPLTAALVSYRAGISDKQMTTLIIKNSVGESPGKIQIQSICFKEQNQLIQNLFHSRDQLKKTIVKTVKFHIIDLFPQINSQSKIDLESQLDIIEKKIEIYQNYQICITAQLFNTLFNNQTEQMLSDKQRQFIEKITVFCRAKSDDKIKIVSFYQRLGRIVAMCGDGTNDTGAIKRADLGLYISDANTQIPAPFISSINNISSLVELIKQCRSSLSTNFSFFNIMVVYSLIQSTSTIISQFNYCYPHENQYLYWDIFCNFIFLLVIGFTGKQNKLEKKMGNYSLFSVQNLLSLLSLSVLQLIAQIVVNLQVKINDCQIQKLQSQFFERVQFIQVSYINSVLFLNSNIIYLCTMAALTLSGTIPWRKKALKNPLLVLMFLVICTYSLLMIIIPSSRFSILNLVQARSSECQQKRIVLPVCICFGISIIVVQMLLKSIFTRLRQKYPNNDYL